MATSEPDNVTPKPSKTCKGKFLPVCAFLKTDFHVQHCRDDNSETPQQKFALYRKLSSEIKREISRQEDIFGSVVSGPRKRERKICTNCVTELQTLCNNRDKAAVGTFDHSYASSCSTDDTDSDIIVDPETSPADLADVYTGPLETSTPVKRAKMSKLEGPSACSSSGTGCSTSRPRAEDIIGQLKELPLYELGKVARYLGESQVKRVREDIVSMANEYQDLDFFTQLDSGMWVDDRNPVVTNFIKGIAGQSEPIKSKEAYSLVRAVEQIYSTQTLRHVLPWSFAENVVMNSVVSSKLAANINGLSSPGGSYMTIRRWLENQACNPLPAPVGDCVCAFDNDQVIGKTYHVRANQKQKSSVITSVCMAELDPSGSLQKQGQLKPSLWSQNNFETSEMLDYDSEHHTALSNVHYGEVYDCLNAHLTVVHGQLTSGSDEVDTILAQQQFQREWKVCSACQHHNPRSKRLCQNCKVPLSSAAQGEGPNAQQPIAAKRPRETVEEVSFDDAQQCLLESHKGESESTSSEMKQTNDVHVHVKPRDPIFVNPNSFESVKKVFLDLGRDFRIQKYVTDPGEFEVRDWLLVVCDGIPYTIGQKVIADTFRCITCEAVIYGKSSFTDHCVTLHNIEEESVQYVQEFDWVHLRIGFGHYEMNMLRSFFEMNWEAMIKDLSYTLGFRTENAQKYAKKGSDHHKSWELLCIFYEGSLQELVRPYVMMCVEKGEEPTPEGYLNWSKDVKSPNYQFMQEQTLTYAQSILNFRKGVRYNSKDLIMAGKFKHSPIFHGRNHPKYQLIELTEARNDLIMPAPVKDFVHGHQSISASGHPGRGEDMDFQLENLNKRSKAWTPTGVPTEKDWLRTFRNLEKLDMMRADTLRRMGCEDPKNVTSTSSSHTPKKAEILAWRAALRESNFLQNPMEDCVMKSVSGEPLDEQLPNFTHIAWSRRRYLYTVFFQGAATGTSIPDPIFVVPEERTSYHDIRNQTKEVISSKVSELISQVTDEEVKRDFTEEWASVQKKRKEHYLLFHDKVWEVVDNLNTALVLDEPDAADQNEL